MVVRQLVKLKLDMDANNLPKAIKLWMEVFVLVVLKIVWCVLMRV